MRLIYLQKKETKERRHISYFNPDVKLLEESYQDFSSNLKKFTTVNEYDTFSVFLNDDAVDYKNSGDGVSYIVWNVICNDNGIEEKREIVAYYTLATTSIPYEDRIRLDEEEAKATGKEFDIQICGISAVEIKMFAVDNKYQDVFYQHDGEDLPVAAWILRNIVNYAETLLNTVIGFKAIFLHSVPEAVDFYLLNGFVPMQINMKPLHSIDSEFTAMYMSLREVHMNYED